MLQCWMLTYCSTIPLGSTCFNHPSQATAPSAQVSSTSSSRWDRPGMTANVPTQRFPCITSPPTCCSSRWGLFHPRPSMFFLCSFLPNDMPHNPLMSGTPDSWNHFLLCRLLGGPLSRQQRRQLLGMHRFGRDNVLIVEDLAVNPRPRVRGSLPQARIRVGTC